eukprot:TRINITY_DN742_c0_g1_i1.p1 TRINITY_DN742_c0_g1~~TRINITY_DN742_c0_g1_i1.p1  ORF type:complete len:666 (-),score=282.74 TRINITY_DN742_c0_g1_i1:62-2059(-)
MQESKTSLSLLRPIGYLAGGVVNFGINSSTKVIKGGLHLVDRSVGTSVNLTKSAIGLVRNSVNLGCDLAVGVVDVGKNLTTGVIKNVEGKVEYATETTKRILHVDGTKMMPATKTHAKLQVLLLSSTMPGYTYVPSTLTKYVPISELQIDEEESLINRNRLKKVMKGQNKPEVADLTRLVMIAEEWNADVNKESPIVSKSEKKKEQKKDVGVKKAKAPEAAGAKAGKSEQQDLESKKRKVSDRLQKQQLISMEFKNELAEKRREFERRRPKRPLSDKLKLDIQSRRKAFDENLSRQQLFNATEFKRELIEMRHEFDQRRELKIEEQRHQREVEVKRKEFQERKQHDKQVKKQHAQEKRHDEEVRLLSQKEKKQRQLEIQRKHEEEAKQTQEQQEQLKENRRKLAKEEKLKRDVELKRRLDYEEAMKRDAEKRQQQKHQKEVKGKKLNQDKIWTLKAENAALRETLARLKEEKLIAYSEHFPTLPKKEESLESFEVEQPKRAEQPKPVEQKKEKKEKKEEKPAESVQKERLPLDQAQEIMASNVLSKPIEGQERKLDESEQQQEELKEFEKPIEQEQELTATDKYFVHHVVQPNISFADAVKMNPEEAEQKRKRFEEQQAQKQVAEEFHRDKHAVSQEVVLQEMKAAPIKTENPFDILNQADAMSA